MGNGIVRGGKQGDETEERNEVCGEGRGCGSHQEGLETTKTVRGLGKEEYKRTLLVACK